MIRSDIQDRAHHRTESMYRLELETAHLCYDHRVLPCLRHDTRIWVSDITHHKSALLPVPHDLSEEGRCSRLSVCPRNGKDISFSKHIGKLDLSPYGDSRLFHPIHDRKVRRDPRAHHYQRQAAQKLFRKLSQHHAEVLRIPAVISGLPWRLPIHGVCFRQVLSDLPSDVFRIQLLIPVIENYPGAFPQEESCCRLSTDAGAKYKYLFPFDLHLLYPH